jgi:uncharacterized membrane protein
MKSGSRFVRHLRARPRLFVAVLVGALIFAGLSFAPVCSEWEFHTRIALAMDSAAFLFLGTTWMMMARSTPERMRWRARLADEGAAAMLFMTFGGLVFSLVIVVMEMHGVKDLPPLEEGLHLALSAVSLVCSWLVTHTMFALHYAHTFYGEGGHGGVTDGFDFHSKGERDYLDFIYQAFTIAVTGATADVDVTGRSMRRIVVVHSVMSYFLNVVVVSLTVGLAAGLI